MAVTVKLSLNLIAQIDTNCADARTVLDDLLEDIENHLEDRQVDWDGGVWGVPVAVLVCTDGELVAGVRWTLELLNWPDGYDAREWVDGEIELWFEHVDVQNRLADRLETYVGACKLDWNVD